MNCAVLSIEALLTAALPAVFVFALTCESGESAACEGVRDSITSGGLAALMAVVFVFLPFFVHGLALVWPEREVPADALLRGRLPILYRPEYNIRAGGIEKMHPFDSCKYGRVFDGLVEGGFLRAEEAVAPPMITMSELRRVHADSYLVKLGYALALSRALEVPVCFLPGCILRWRVLRPMLFASKGSLLAVDAAMRHGWAVNLAGGYHHASARLSRGHGFCVIADISLMVEHLRRTYRDRVRRILIIDLDAHQGDGHEHDCQNDPDVTIIDGYHHRIFPDDHEAMQRVDVDIEFHPRDRGARMLQDVRAALRHVFADPERRPDFVIYNAGTDILEGDPLGGLSMTRESILERDRLVFEACLVGVDRDAARPEHDEEGARRGASPARAAGSAGSESLAIPIAMLLSGGYQRSNAPLIAESLLHLDREFHLVDRARAANTL